LKDSKFNASLIPFGKMSLLILRNTKHCLANWLWFSDKVRETVPAPLPLGLAGNTFQAYSSAMPSREELVEFATLP